MKNGTLRQLRRAGLAALVMGATATMVVSNAQDGADLDGRALYLDFGCHQCHGFEGQGSQASPPNPRIAPTPYPLEAFSVFIRTPVRLMPPYSPNVMTDEQLGAIYEYVASIPEPPAVDDIPALSDL
ncbi:MAG: c-type cytochrome [Gammaproteobacteria bacterium]